VATPWLAEDKIQATLNVAAVQHNKEHWNALIALVIDFSLKKMFYYNSVTTNVCLKASCMLCVAVKAILKYNIFFVVCRW